MSDLITEIVDWFMELEEWIPGAGNWARDLIVGKVPEADKEIIYDLAGRYGEAADQLADLYEQAARLGDPLVDWMGDSGQQWNTDWPRYLEAMRATSDGLSSLQQALEGFGFQIELQEFMVALNLLLLGVMLVQLIFAAFFSGGVSLSGVVPAFMLTGRLIAAGTTRTLTAMASFSIRALLKDLSVFLAKVVPTLVTSAGPRFLRTTLPTTVRGALPTLTRTTLPTLTRTALPLVRREAPALLRTALPNVARSSMTSLGRGLLPRNVIARNVADRMANQWLRTTLTRGLMRTLETEIGGKALSRGAAVAVRTAYARALEARLAQQFGARLAARGMDGALGRLGLDAAGQQAARTWLTQQAAAQAAKVSFGHELAKYVGLRMAAGGLIMGGGNLLGQLHVISSRALDPGLFDLGQAGMYAGQGAAFGAGMWGSPLGHILGGATAGAGFAGATGEDILAGAVQGGFVGAVFGAAGHLQANPIRLPLRIGEAVHVVPTEHGPGFVTNSRVTGLETWHAPGRGAEFFRTEDGPLPEGGRLAEWGRIDHDGNVLFHHRFVDTAPALDGVPAPPAREAYQLTGPPHGGPSPLSATPHPGGDGGVVRGAGRSGPVGTGGHVPDGSRPGDRAPGVIRPQEVVHPDEVVQPAGPPRSGLPELPPADPAKVPLDLPPGDATRLQVDLKRLTGHEDLSRLASADVERVLDDRGIAPETRSGVRQHFAEQGADGVYRARTGPEIRQQVERLELTAERDLAALEQRLREQHAAWERQRTADPHSMQLFDHFPAPPERVAEPPTPRALSGREAWTEWQKWLDYQADRRVWEAGVRVATEALWSSATRAESPRLASEADVLLSLRQPDGTRTPMNHADTVRVLDRLYAAGTTESLRDAYQRLRDEANLGGRYIADPRPAAPRSADIRPADSPEKPAEAGPRPVEDRPADVRSPMDTPAARNRAAIDIEQLRTGYGDRGGGGPAVAAHDRDLHVGPALRAQAIGDATGLRATIDQTINRVPATATEPVPGLSSPWRTADLQPTGDGQVGVRFHDGAVVEVVFDVGRHDSGASVRLYFPDLRVDEAGQGRPADAVRVVVDERFFAEHPDSRAWELVIALRTGLNEIHTWLTTPPTGHDAVDPPEVAAPPYPADRAVPAGPPPVDLPAAVQDTLAAWPPVATSWVAATEPDDQSRTVIRFRDEYAVTVGIEVADLPAGMDARIDYPPLRFDRNGVGHPAGPVQIVLTSRPGPSAGRPVVEHHLADLLDQVHDWLIDGPDPLRDTPEPARGRQVPLRRIPVPTGPAGDRPTVEAPEAVRAAFNAQLDELLRGRPPGAPDQPYLVTWDARTQRLTAHYPDGLAVWFVPQVNTMLPVGRPEVVRPSLTGTGDRWAQTGPAVVTLTVAGIGQLPQVWRALHDALHGILPPQPPPSVDRAAQEAAVREAEAGDDAAADEAATRGRNASPDDHAAADATAGRADQSLPVIGPGQVRVWEATPGTPPPPEPLTAAWVRAALTNPEQPPTVRRWIEDHLTVDGTPKSQADLDATLARLADEAVRAVDAPPAGGSVGGAVESEQIQPNIILIGPINSGKSTLAELLSQRLGLPRYELDELRWGYYTEIGYDEQVTQERRAAGFLSLYQYWKPFEVHAVRRFLSTHGNCVVDFGAGHSVYEDDEKFEQVREALEPHPFVVLVLPSPDPDESIQTLGLRSEDLPEDVRSINEHFVRHHSNYSLAKFVVFTNNKTPEESRDEILNLIERHPRFRELAARRVVPEHPIEEIRRRHEEWLGRSAAAGLPLTAMELAERIDLDADDAAYVGAQTLSLFGPDVPLDHDPVRPGALEDRVRAGAPAAYRWVDRKTLDVTLAEVLAGHWNGLRTALAEDGVAVCRYTVEDRVVGEGFVRTDPSDGDGTGEGSMRPAVTHTVELVMALDHDADPPRAYVVRAEPVPDDDPPVGVVVSPSKRAASGGAATVIPGTSLADRFGSGTRPSRGEQVRALTELLESRWTTGDGPGQRPRGDAFLAGVEPTALPVDPAAPAAVVHVLMRPRRGRAVPAEIRFADLGVDADGRRLRAVTEIVEDRTPGAGRHAVRLQITIDAAHSADDSLYGTIAHEGREAFSLAQARNRHGFTTRPRRTDVLTPDARVPRLGLREPRLSPHDLGGLADLHNELINLTVTVDPVRRGRIVDDIVAIRAGLGLDPRVDPVAAKARWALVDRQVPVEGLPRPVRLQLRTLRYPGWRDLVPLTEAAARLGERAGHEVRVSADGRLEIHTNASWRPVRMRVVGADLPVGVLYELDRAPDGQFVARVPHEVLADPVRAADAIAPALSAAMAIRATRGRLKKDRTSLSGDVEVADPKARLDRDARADVAAAVAVAHQVMDLAWRESYTADPEARRRLAALRTAERGRSHAALKRLGLLEGQPGFVERREAVERTPGVLPRNSPVVALLHPWERFEPDPEAVRASVAAMAPLVARPAGAKGAQVDPATGELRVILDDDAFTVHRVVVAVDLPPGDGTAGELSGGPGSGWRLRLSPDATRPAVGLVLSAAVAEIAQRGAGVADPAEVWAAMSVAQLRFLHAWHRVAGPLARAVVEVTAIGLTAGLVGLAPQLDQQAGAVAGAQQFVDRITGRRRTVGPQEASVAASRTVTGSPPAWMYLPGRLIGSAITTGATGFNNHLGGWELPVLLAHGATGYGYGVFQAIMDGALRRSLDLQDERESHRKMLLDTVSAAGLAGVPESGQPAGTDQVPARQALMFYLKRTLPSVIPYAALGVGLWLGGYGAKSLASVGPSLATGLAYGAADHLAEGPEAQARADYQHAFHSDIEGRRSAALGIARFGAAELRARVRRQVEAGTLTGAERAALIELLRVTRDALIDAQAVLGSREQAFREQIQHLRSTRRLLYQASIGGLVQLGTVGRELTDAVVGRMRSAPPPPPPAELPGKAPSSHYVLRSAFPAFVNGVTYVGMVAVIQPQALPLAGVVGAATAAAGIGVGQGWDNQRADDLAEQPGLDWLKDLRRIREALVDVEAAWRLLGGADTDQPGALPATASPEGRELDYPAITHGRRVLIVKHGTPWLLRMTTGGVAGSLLLPSAALTATTMAVGTTIDVAAGLGDAWFRKASEKISRRHEEWLGRSAAAGLPLTAMELAERIHGQAVEGGRLARVSALRAVLGVAPPRIDLDADDAAYVGAQTLSLFGPEVPLDHDPVRPGAVEDRVRAGAPAAYRWVDRKTLDVTLAEVLAGHWNGLRTALAEDGVAVCRYTVEDRVVGEGFVRTDPSDGDGTGEGSMRPAVTHTVELVMALDHDADPPRAYVVRAEPVPDDDAPAQ